MNLLDAARRYVRRVRPGRLRRTAILLLVVGAAAALGADRDARAQAPVVEQIEQIERFDSDLSIRSDGTLLVEETIEYTFPPGEARHGIFRVLPVRYRYDDEHDRVIPVTIIGVASPSGAPSEFTTSRSGANVHVRIGDPDRTITGTHTYVIRYAVEGALNAFSSHDELAWNVTGSDWEVPIARATAKVRGPEPIARAACFAGFTGARSTCTAVSTDNGVVTAGAGPLVPHSEMTVIAALPKGAVAVAPPVLEERWTLRRAFTTDGRRVALAVGLSLAVLGALAFMLWHIGRDRRSIGGPVDVAFGDTSAGEQPVELFERPITPVEFEPPEHLRPGQVGTLVDEIAQPLDVTASIIDLAVRGYLRIEEIPKEGWFGRADWALVRLRDDTGDLLEYERILLEALFESGPRVVLSDLKQKFHEDLTRVQRALYDDVVARGWFVRRPDKVRLMWSAIGVGIAVLGVGLVWLTARFTTFGLVALPVPLAGLALAFSARWMPRRTAKGTGALRRALGFRRFIMESERERARFAEQQQLFSEYLPYAVVFGATKQWARAFAGLAAAPATAWYVGSDPLAFEDFGRTIDGFAVTTVGTIRATPAGSGGSGFSGGAGGGVGGGGGGSW
jgi:hypothetical protein